MPQSSSSPLPVSTNEWTPSDNMAELPVRKAATNLVIAMARLPPTAAKITVRDPPAAMNCSGMHQRNLGAVFSPPPPFAIADGASFALELDQPGMDLKARQPQHRFGKAAVERQG